MIYNKLVRDRIPEIITARGKRPTFHVLTPAEYLSALAQKLTEEASEYLESNELSELADVYDVLCAILAARGVTFAELKHLSNLKTAQNGGFKKRYFLTRVDADE